MKSTGVIRRVDELGRVVIPIEIRTQFGISEKDPMEIYVDGSSIILKIVFFVEIPENLLNLKANQFVRNVQKIFLKFVNNKIIRYF